MPSIMPRQTIPRSLWRLRFATSSREIAKSSQARSRRWEAVRSPGSRRRFASRRTRSYPLDVTFTPLIRIVCRARRRLIAALALHAPSWRSTANRMTGPTPRR